MIRLAKLRTAGLLFALALAQPCVGTSPVIEEAPAAAAITDTGSLGTAPYRVDIPAVWNGDLVMLLHGYEPKGVPRETPWPQNEATSVFLSQGYAVAQSAYSTQGWAVNDAVPDNEQLRAYFSSKYKKPARTYLVGVSLGGHIAIASLERYEAHYAGALSLCGMNVPAARVFDDAQTALVAFDYFFPGALATKLSDPTAAVQQQWPMMQAIEVALQGNETAAAQLSKLMEVQRPGLAGVLSLQYLVLREAQARAGGLPVDNLSKVYSGFDDDAAFNKGVARYAGDAAAIKQLTSDFSGRISKPLILQYNQQDPTVPKRYHHVYAQLAKAAGNSSEPTVLPPAGDGHCDFSTEQIGAAFGELKKRVDRDRRQAES